MKIILTGATGFIGSEVLRQAIADPAISRVYTLTRKPLSAPYAKHEKVRSILHDDFAKYDEELLKELRGVEACIWMIGVPFPKGDPRPIDIGFTQAASRAFTTHLQPYIPSSSLDKPKPFKFIYLSGAAAVQDTSSSLWFNAKGRRSRGEAETALLEFAQQDGKGKYQGFVMRPGMVCRFGWMAVSQDYSVPLDWLAGALLGVAKGDAGGDHGASTRVENKVLVEWGKRLSGNRH